MEEIDDNNNDNDDEGMLFGAWERMVQEMQLEAEIEEENAAMDVPILIPPPPPQPMEDVPVPPLPQEQLPARRRIRPVVGGAMRERWEQHRQRRREVRRREEERVVVPNRNNILDNADVDDIFIMHRRLHPRRQPRGAGAFRLVGGPVAAAAILPDENDDNNNNDANPNNNNIDGNNNNRAVENAAEAEDEFDDFMMLDLVHGRIPALRASLEDISSGLFDMVREGRTCISVLSGWGRTEENSCQCIVQHCANHPEEAGYISRLGRTPLHEACLKGACRHVIQALLEATNNKGADEWDFQRNTPLHLLFRDNSCSTTDMSSNANLVWSPEDLAQVVGDLLAVNPSVVASRRNNDGDTPLHSACMAPETMVDPSTIVQLLQASPRAATLSNRNHATPLRLHCQRRNASPEVAGLLLEANPHALIGLDNERGWAPIHAAAANANFQLLRYLVESFPESVKVQTSQRQTALHLLCQHHTHLVSSLSVPSSSSNSNNHNSNSWNRNSNSNNSSIPNVEAAVEFLLEADPDAIMHQDKTDGYTPLHLVCKTEGSRQVPLPVVRLLLGCNPKAASVPDQQQYLPLHHACEMSVNPEVIQALVEACPEATSALTFKKDSALSLACTANKSTETIKLLIDANKEVLTQKNDYGFCPLHCVCRTHQPRMGIVKALVEACPESVNLQTNSGETPFHLASSNTGAFVGVLQLLTQTQSKLSEATQVSKQLSFLEEPQAPIGGGAFSNGSKMSVESFLRDHDPSSDNASMNLRRTPSVIRAVTTNKMGNTPRKFWLRKVKN